MTGMSAWSEWVAAASGELTILLAAVCLVNWMGLTRLHPRIRNGLWLLLLTRLVVPPAWVPTAPGASLSLPGGVARPLEVTGAWASAWPVFGLWAAGVVACVVLGWWRARQAATHLVPANDADQRDVRALAERIGGGRGARNLPAILIAPNQRAPYVTGLWRPCLVLPGTWRSWPAHTLTHALAHELAHLRRRDLVAEACWTAVAAAYWFHPLVWLARSRAHQAREACVDAEVAMAFGPAYRHTLLELVAGWHGLTPGESAPVRHGWGPAVARLKALERWPSPPTWRGQVGAAALLAAAGWLIVPSHVTPLARGIPTSVLVDPAGRQQAGLGSMHVRYELLRRSQNEGRRP